MGRNVHLVGSVPMANARDVFENVSAVLGGLYQAASGRRDRRARRLDYVA